jgi:hypothetical protein
MHASGLREVSIANLERYTPVESRVLRDKVDPAGGQAKHFSTDSCPFAQFGKKISMC